MITITKERLLKIQQWRETYGPGSNVVLPAEEAEELARIALASLEAEAVGYMNRFTGRVFTLEEQPGANTDVQVYVPLYTAQPAPVSVPDEITFEKIAEITASQGYEYSINECICAASWWNACRAAMLQGADGNSPVIPDGSEDTKRLDWLDAQNKRLNEYYGTSYGWKFDANFQRNSMMLNDSNYPVMTVRQAIDEAIAAAPQQEVNP